MRVIAVSLPPAQSMPCREGPQVTGTPCKHQSKIEATPEPSNRCIVRVIFFPGRIKGSHLLNDVIEAHLEVPPVTDSTIGTNEAFLTSMSR